MIENSDQGGQLGSLRYQQPLRAHNLTALMGRVAADDNVAMESLIALPQKAVHNRRTWYPGDETDIAIVTRNERTYHRRSCPRALGTRTSLECEAITGHNTLATKT